MPKNPLQDRLDEIYAMPIVNVESKPTSISDDNEGFASTRWLTQLAEMIDPNKDIDRSDWKPLVGPQTSAFYSSAKETFFGGAAGGGKFLWVNNLLLTPFGWKRMGDVKVGDLACNPDGSVCKVIGVYPQGEQDVWEFEFLDGAKVLSGAEHLWSWKKSGKTQKAYKTAMSLHDDYFLRRWEVGTTAQIIEYHEKQVKRKSEGKRPNWVIMPVTKPVKFTMPVNPGVRNHWIDPYLLGLLIGDGSISSSHLTITTKDDEIVEWVRQYLSENLELSKFNWDNDKTIRLSANKELVSKLQFFDLYGKRSNNKFIPTPYLMSDVPSRFALMQGLMDTDGYVDSRGHLSYTTVSEQLALNVQYLARSLGATAKIVKDKAGYKDDEGVYVECQDAYTVYMQAHDTSEFVRLSRKRDRLKQYNGGVSDYGRRLVNIKYEGKRECVCIAVSNPNRLYITDDFIVTHNTDLMIGLATSPLSPHRKSIIFRTTYNALKDVATRIEGIYGDKVHFKAGTAMRFEGLPLGKTLELGSVSNFKEAQKYKGRPHDLKLFDELPDISETVYTFLIGWARTATKGVPVRIVSSGNPPTTSAGQWVIRRWAAWLDPNYGRKNTPAKPGELRWYATVDGKEVECKEDDVFVTTAINGKPVEIRPQSRTFIPARITDNPYLMETDYMATLNSMPEPFRSQLLYGDFTMSMEADRWQVISNELVNASMRYWDELNDSGEIKKNVRVNVTFGLDVGGDGEDYTALAKMTASGIEYVEYIKEPDLMKQADMINVKLASFKQFPIGVDANGLGLGLAQRLVQLGFKVIPIKGSNASKSSDRNRNFKFFNVRSEMWWKLREQLEDGKFAIPPMDSLFSELITPRFEIIKDNVIRVMSQEEIKANTENHVSPDGANAIMYAKRTADLMNSKMRMV